VPNIPLSADQDKPPNLTGLPILDAAKVLVRLAAASTINDLNSLSDKGLALQIGAAIFHDCETETLLADLRARILANQPRLAEQFRHQQAGAPALEGTSSAEDALREIGAAAFLEGMNPGDFLALNRDAIIKFGARNLLGDAVIELAIAELRRRRRGEEQRLLSRVAT
jgi:hypothetical protein